MCDTYALRLLMANTALLSYDSFSGKDISNLIKPFIAVLEDDKIADAYLKWISKIEGMGSCIKDEAAFGDVFHIPAELIESLDNEITQIYR